MHTVVLEGSVVLIVSVTMIDTFRAMQDELATDGTTLLLTGFPPETLEVMRRSRWFAEAEAAGLTQPTVDAALAAAASQGPGVSWSHPWLSSRSGDTPTGSGLMRVRMSLGAPLALPVARGAFLCRQAGSYSSVRPAWRRRTTRVPRLRLSAPWLLGV